MRIPTDPNAWVRDSCVRIDMRVQGDLNLWTEAKRKPKFLGKTLGGRAATEVCTENLLHEFAHFIETERHRFVRPGYGLKVKQDQFLGHSYCAMNTAQATLREIRVMGIQAVLADHFGCPLDIRHDWAPIVQFLPDWCPTYIHFGLSVKETEDLSSRARASLLFDRVAADIEAEKAKHKVEVLYDRFRGRCAIHDSYVGRYAL